MSHLSACRSPSPEDLSDDSKAKKKDCIIRRMQAVGKPDRAKPTLRSLPFSMRVHLLLNQNHKHLQEEHNVNIFRSDWRSQVEHAEELRAAVAAESCSISCVVPGIDSGVLPDPEIELASVASPLLPPKSESPWYLHNSSLVGAHQGHGTAPTAPSYSFRKHSKYSRSSTAEIYLWEKRDECTDRALSDENKKKAKKMLVPYSPGTPANSFKRRSWYESIDCRKYFLYVPTSGPLNKTTTLCHGEIRTRYKDCNDDAFELRIDTATTPTPLKQLQLSRLDQKQAAYNDFDAMFETEWLATAEAKEQADKHRMKRHDSAVSLSPPPPSSPTKTGKYIIDVTKERHPAGPGISNKRIATSLSPKKKVKKPALMVSELSIRSSGGQQQQRQQGGNQQNRHESERGRQQNRGRPAVRYIACQAESMKYSRREISP